MAIEFFTGFEGCGSTGDVRSLFDTYTNSTFAYSSTGGYANGKCMTQGSYTDRSITKNCTTATTKATGGHFNAITTRASSAVDYSLLTFRGPDIRISNYDTNGIRVYRGTTLIATASDYMLTTLSHLEVELFSDATAGTVKIKLNGTTILDATGLNTGGADITGISWGCPSTNIKWDNLYIADALQGELISVLCKPSSDASVQFARSTGADNYALVADTAQDGDSTYVESDTVGHIDLYGYEDVSSGYSVQAVSLVTVARKDDAGLRTLQPIARQSSTNYDIGNELTLTDSYPAVLGEAQIATIATAPSGASWTTEIFNAIEWGFEVAL
jgi:hypothetical protein